MIKAKVEKLEVFDRSDAIVYFDKFKSDKKGIYFYKNHAFLFSKDIDAMVDVGGDRLTEVLLDEYGGTLKTSPQFKNLCLETEAMFHYNKYDNLFYISRRKVCNMLKDYKVRSKKIGYIEFDCEDNRLNINLHIDNKIDKMNIDIGRYRVGPKTLPASFNFAINAIVLEKIICNGFGNCDRIGMKFSQGTKIILFNENRHYYHKYWAVRPNGENKSAV